MFVQIMLRNQICKTDDLCIVLETKVHISNYCRRSVRNSLMYGDKQWLREIIECPSYIHIGYKHYHIQCQSRYTPVLFVDKVRDCFEAICV